MKVKKGYVIFHDDVMGLWHAIREQDKGFGWRSRAINLGYPKKRAYKKAKELGLYT